MSAKIQAWFQGLAPAARAVVIVIIGIPIGIVLLFPDTDWDAVLEWWPLIVLLLISAGVGGFFVWRYLENRKLEQQLEINRDLANKGRVIILRPKPGRVTWKTLVSQGVNFATSLSNVVGQFPDGHLSLEITGTSDGIIFSIWCPDEIFPSVQQSVLSCFDVQVRNPQSVIKKGDVLAGLDDSTMWRVFKLSQKSAFPLKQASDFQTSSLAHILASLGRSSGMGAIGVQIIIKNPDRRWQQVAQTNLAQARQTMEGQRRAVASDRARLAQLEAKADAMTGVAATIVAFTEPASKPRFDRLAQAIINTTGSRYNKLIVADEGQGAERVIERHFDHKAGNSTVLSASELAPFWHVPEAGGDVMSARGFDAPPPPEVIVDRKPPFDRAWRILGRGIMQGGEEVFVKWTHGFDTLVHSFVCGPTGVGKSTVLAFLMAQDINAGYGTILLEPHRDLTLTVIDSIPDERARDVLWINPTNPERSFGLNLMDYGGIPERREAVASQFMTVLQKIVGGDWNTAVRMKRLLENGLGAVMEAEQLPTMLHLMAFFRHESYRTACIEHVTNPVVKEFWETDFPGWNTSAQNEAMGPVFNRVEPLVRLPMVRHVVAQNRTTIPMQRVMDAGKIVLIDLSAKDERVGERNAEALGALIIALVWGASSARVKGQYPIPTYFWVDEFQNYVTEEFVNILAEARGFGLGLNLATQYYARLPKWMQGAILTNCRTKLSGAVNSPDEARLMKRIFDVDEGSIRSLDAYTYLASVSAQKRASATFTLYGLPPVGLKPGNLNLDKLTRVYRQLGGGQMPQPKDLGGIPLDFFAEIDDMSGSDQTAWEAHQRQIKGLDYAAQAQYLADLKPAEWENYIRFRQQDDKRQYQKLSDDQGSLTKGEWIRQLSALQVETPRIEIEAQRLRLAALTESADDDFGDLLF